MRSRSSAELVRALQDAARAFGPAAERQKLRLLRRLRQAGRFAVADLVALQGELAFVRAWPDSPAVRAAADAVVRQVRGWVAALPPTAPGLGDSGLAGTAIAYSYHYGVLRQLAWAWPGTVEFDWDALDDETPLSTALRLSLPAAEVDGLDDDRLTLREWLARCRPRAATGDLATAIGIVACSALAEPVKAQLFDAGDLPFRYSLRHPGQGRCEVTLADAPLVCQREPIERDRYPLPPLIQAPLPAVRPLPRAAARAALAVAHAALCVRRLEIWPLIHANERDVLRVRCERGIEVVLVGTAPAFRAALESLYCFVVFKNGVPIGYGPAAVFLGACELGLNLFPEFRGGEVRLVYAQVMRVLHHVLGADYFFLQEYGMGVDNPDAIASGAFWFYRKLGFAAENPAVERLARAEEQRMREEPGYRSDRRMLHRLKHTRAFLDLSGGRSTWFDFGRLGVRVSEFVARRFGGDRALAAERCARQVVQALGLGGRGGAAALREGLAGIAPVLAMVPDLRRWTAAEKRALARALAQRGPGSEAPACRALGRHARLRAALRALTNG